MSIEIPSDCPPIVEQLIATGIYTDEAAIVADARDKPIAAERWIDSVQAICEMLADTH